MSLTIIKSIWKGVELMTQINPIFKFEDAERVQCKASIMIEGLPGKGKSGLALIAGYILSGKDWKKVFDIDTENKSANLFVGVDSSLGEPYGKFKVGQLTADIGYRPSNYLAFREAAVASGAATVIKDSISHAWMYKGGVLDIVNEAKQRSKNPKDTYAAWGDEEVIKEKNELLQLIRDPRVHVITTVRVKEKMEYVPDDKGGMKLQSLGEQQIQQADLKYEPDLVLHMLKPGKNKNGEIQHPVARVVKTRYAIFDEGAEYEFTPDLLLQLKVYLEDGVDPAELLEKQRQDYIEGVKALLDSKPGLVPIWQVMKKDAGYEELKLVDMPLAAIKPLYVQLIN